MSARATTGGPDLAQVMGWDPARQEVYVRIEHGGGGSQFDESILRLQLRAEGRFREVWWSANRESDSMFQARKGRLERALKSLPSTACGSIPMEASVIAADTVQRGPWRWPRYHVRVGAFERVGGGMWDVEAFRDTTVRLVQCFEIPGQEERVGVLSFLGLPVESGYEVQVPVLITPRAESISSIQIPWK